MRVGGGFVVLSGRGSVGFGRCLENFLSFSFVKKRVGPELHGAFGRLEARIDKAPGLCRREYGRRTGHQTCRG